MTTKFVPQKGPPKTWDICTFTAGYQAKPYKSWLEEVIHLFNLPKRKKKKKRKKKNKGKKSGQLDTEDYMTIYCFFQDWGHST